MASIDAVLTKDVKPYEIRRNARAVHTADLPHDMPKMVVRWHYAVDSPKRRLYERPGAPKLKPPVNFVAFSERDSNSLEAAWQESGDQAAPKVSVNEDHLFEVDVEARELGPTYWRGPIYEVRRGTWHFADGGVLKPCDENLGTQVEDGYLKVKPWRDIPAATATATATGGEETPVSSAKSTDIAAISSQDKLSDVSKDSRLLATPENGTQADLERRKSLTDKTEKNTEVKKDTQREHMRPLFGAYTGKYILYTGKTTAWLLSDDLYGKISSSFFQSVTRGVHMGGQKLKRGYTDPPAPVEKEKPAEVADNGPENPTAPAEASGIHNALFGSKAEKEANAGTGAAPANQNKLESDFDVSGTDNPDRKIEHLILCCHGIGQKLGERLESVNFVNDVNVLRRNFKTTFMHSRELQTLSPEKQNCGVQVLPVEWRQNIQFGMSRDLDEPTAQTEKDVSSALSNGELDEEEHATLEDITIEGVQTIRNLVSDVLLDILLYYQPSYREKIVRAVAKEMNRVYGLFKEKHPTFNGKVSILGHSLGSAIAFDILCRQPVKPGEKELPKTTRIDRTLSLDFPVENFYAVGSPIGLFQMLRGKNIAARTQTADADLPFSPLGGQQDPFDGPPISFPKCQSFYNIFHPADPVSYRIEPLVSKHAAKLKPYPMPYTKAGFRQQLVGLSSIPQRAYEGASSYWGAIRSSITNSIVSRSLGYGDLSSPSPTSKAEIETEKQKVANEIQKHHQETLFAGFEKAWGSNHAKKSEGEAKLKALNSAGRIDYALQEEFLNLSYVSALSAHLQYWGDSDVSYFILSYILLHGSDSPAADVPTPKRSQPVRYPTTI